MIFAHADYQDPADTERGWDDEDTRVDECVHGAHPVECARCTSAGFHAAVSGEGGDMEPEDDLKLDWTTRLSLLLDEATDLQLKSGRYAFDREEKKRLEMAKETIRALDPNAPKPRKTRKDAGTTRPRKTEAA